MTVEGTQYLVDFDTGSSDMYLLGFSGTKARVVNNYEYAFYTSFADGTQVSGERFLTLASHYLIDWKGGV